MSKVKFKAPKGRTANFVMVDKKLATEWKTRNEGNRKPIDSSTSAICYALRKKHWLFNGATIVFDWNGNLIDGQHRLDAIIKMDVVVELLVVKGCDPQAFLNIDNGIVRDLAGILSSRGWKYPVVAQASIKCINLFLSGKAKTLGTAGNPKISGHTMEELLNVDNNEARIKEAVYDSARAYRDTPVTHSTLAIAHYILHNVSDAKAYDFMEFFISGAIGDKKSPILKARNHLIKERSLAKEHRRDRYDRHHALSILIKAWNAWMNGEELEDSELKHSKEFPTPIS